MVPPARPNRKAQVACDPALDDADGRGPIPVAGSDRGHRSSSGNHERTSQGWRRRSVNRSRTGIDEFLGTDLRWALLEPPNLERVGRVKCHARALSLADLSRNEPVIADLGRRYTPRYSHAPAGRPLGLAQVD